jgi:hypothetical protein
VLFAASVFVILPLRLVLAVLSVATWTAAWRTIDTLSAPFLLLFRFGGLLDRQVIGNAQLADFAALVAFAVLAVYLLALLTVRRIA